MTRSATPSRQDIANGQLPGTVSAALQRAAGIGTLTEPETMSLRTNERQIHRIFEIALILKALHSLLEITSGIILTAVSTGTLLKIAKLLTHGELLEDPNDLVANYILHLAQTFSLSAKTATVFFLLSHGFVKLVLVLSVMKGFSWAYPAFMFALGVLISVQSYQLWRHFLLVLLLVTLFDLIVLTMTWHEYRRVSHRHAG